MKKMMKENKGITLIALVVTIVVLVVLATVSINLVFSRNGIISKAESAGKFQTNAIASDRHAMDVYKEHIANAVVSRGGEVDYTYTCPYCGEGHNRFDGGAVIFEYNWYGTMPCTNCDWAGGWATTNVPGGNCPKCGTSLGKYWESEGEKCYTLCCDRELDYYSVDESDWKN